MFDRQTEKHNFVVESERQDVLNQACRRQLTDGLEFFLFLSETGVICTVITTAAVTVAVRYSICCLQILPANVGG